MESGWFSLFGIAGIGGIALAAVVYIFREIIRKEIFPTLSRNQAYSLLYRIVSLIFILGILGILVYALSIFLNWQNGKTDDVNKVANTQVPSLIPANNINNAISNTAISNNSAPKNAVPTNVNAQSYSNNNLSVATPAPSQAPAILNNDAKAVSTPTPTPLTSEVIGTVLDEDGKSLLGAKIAVEDFPNLLPAQTNSDGVFTLINIPKNSGEGIRIRIFMEGYKEQIKDVVIGARPRKIYLEKIK